MGKQELPSGSNCPHRQSSTCTRHTPPPPSTALHAACPTNPRSDDATVWRQGQAQCERRSHRSSHWRFRPGSSAGQGWTARGNSSHARRQSCSAAAHTSGCRLSEPPQKSAGARRRHPQRQPLQAWTATARQRSPCGWSSSGLIVIAASDAPSPRGEQLWRLAAVCSTQRRRGYQQRLSAETVSRDYQQWLSAHQHSTHACPVRGSAPHRVLVWPAP